jgi:Phage gp6-like head-tail connector protein
MQLVDIENLLGIKIATEQTGIYSARLSAAIDQAKQYCNNPFVDDTGAENIPGGAKMGIALIVQAMGEKQNVQSQSLGDMSKSFFEGGTYKSALKYLKPYRKASFK